MPVKMLWNSIVPLKVVFFTWDVWWDKILTMNQLKKRGFSMTSRCPFCGEAKEAFEHLLIHCPNIWCMWSALFSLSGDCWVCHFLVKDMILGWPSLPLRKKVSKHWTTVPFCLMWAIWKERNCKTRENSNFMKKGKTIISMGKSEIFLDLG